MLVDSDFKPIRLLAFDTFKSNDYGSAREFSRDYMPQMLQLMGATSFLSCRHHV
jgi:hypothetical protein